MTNLNVQSINRLVSLSYETSTIELYQQICAPNIDSAINYEQAYPPTGLFVDRQNQSIGKKPHVINGHLIYFSLDPSFQSQQTRVRKTKLEIKSIITKSREINSAIRKKYRDRRMKRESKRVGRPKRASTHGFKHRNHAGNTQLCSLSSVTSILPISI
ncbi:unnamed protein product [Cuscuta epithymum]|uniref:Uncharacterized protein n=1 Tax=Cuscuta epithymum TaxID=186058 RepID=A0AAV0EQH4_9ASTE|nr:unnamed protein product [Cuscuta epithymum]